MPADGHAPLTRSPVHEAERDYAALICQTPGVLQHDADLDIMRFAGIADGCVQLARKAWREYRATSDEGSRCEFDITIVARMLGDVLADQFGLSSEAASLLDQQIKRAAL